MTDQPFALDARLRNGRKSPLRVGIERGKLVISIGIETLAFACTNNPEWREDPVTITDVDVFAAEVSAELSDEAEDGTNAVHLMLDKACADAISNGSLGVLCAEDSDD